jgi:thiazole/oxazole-forming peptide maturase SagD family component
LLERYACFAYGQAGCIWSSHDELAARNARPASFEMLRLFTDAQHRAADFSYVALTPATRVGWLAGTNLIDGETTYVPGQFVAFGYRRRRDEPRCFYPTSSGCAVATSVKEAVLRGLLEVIERDAVMIRWYARDPPPRLDLDPAALFDAWPGFRKRALRRLEIAFHDMTVDGDIAVVGVTCVERSGRSCSFILSAAAGPDVLRAARKALIEAGQGRPYLKSMVATSPPPDVASAFDDFDRNVRFFAEPANARYVEWFLQNTTPSMRALATVPDMTVEQSLQQVLAHCADRSLSPIAFDMTTPEMRDAGLVACRVMVLDLVPLCVPSAPCLGHPRLAHFIASCQAPPAARDIPSWVPHPFP